MYISRAGLVVLAFTLVISLVSSVPIPISASHSTGINQDLTHRLQLQSQISNHASTLSTVSTIKTGASVNNNPVDTADTQLVRRSIGSKIKAAFSKVGNAIKHVAQKVGDGIKTVAQKVASGVKTAVHKVGDFVKTTGAKIAKFGLKVYSTVTQVAAKVVGFIPEVGTAVGKVLSGVSKAAGVISDHIHANLGSKLEKGMNVMNKAQKVMSFIPTRRELLGS